MKSVMLKMLWITCLKIKLTRLVVLSFSQDEHSIFLNCWFVHNLKWAIFQEHLHLRSWRHSSSNRQPSGSCCWHMLKAYWVAGVDKLYFSQPSDSVLEATETIVSISPGRKLCWGRLERIIFTNYSSQARPIFCSKSHSLRVINFLQPVQKWKVSVEEWVLGRTFTIVCVQQGSPQNVSRLGFKLINHTWN